MPTPILQKEFEFYVANQDALVAKYAGRFVVIKGAEVIGDYPTEADAVIETSKTHEFGTFLVQKCEGGKKNYTQVFHSRVAFA